MAKRAIKFIVGLKPHPPNESFAFSGTSRCAHDALRLAAAKAEFTKTCITSKTKETTPP
ncbi:MAG: hypothetical protein ACJA2U_001293 [Marinomonas primoryensis]|jgi:hypothetical protein